MIPIKDIYVVSDVHGDHKALREALFRAELFDNHGQKDPNAYIVQIGDLANCVKSSVENDLICLSYVGREIDLMLVGNHEIPYFDAQNRFSGFHWNSDISRKLTELLDAGLIAPCYVREDILITHAGMTQQQMPPVSAFGTNAYDISIQIEKAWQNRNHRWFSDCGRARYGTAEIGGILWCDFELEFTPTEFPQIVGHTARGMAMKGNTLCIDTIRQTGLPTVLRLGAR